MSSWENREKKKKKIKELMENMPRQEQKCWDGLDWKEEGWRESLRWSINALKRSYKGDIIPISQLRSGQKH